MSEQAIQELRQMLAAEEHEVAFLDHVPEAAVNELLRATRTTLESQSEALTKAIASGTGALPAPLGRIAATILR